jgi:hypothetical protein
MAHGDLDGAERNQASPAEDKWAHVEQLKRVANRYLDEHHHEIPKIRQLPVADYEVIRTPGWLASSNQPTCGIRARSASNFGTIGGTDVVSCARPKGHAGRHSSEPIDTMSFRWDGRSRAGRTPLTMEPRHPASPHPRTVGSLGAVEPRSLAQPIEPDWIFLLGLLLVAAAAQLILTGRLWQSAIAYVVVSCFVLAVSLLTRTQLLRRYSGR